MSTSSRRSTKSNRRKAGRPPKSENNADKRNAILRAAARVFALKGYHGCRIADVADAAGVAYGLVYHYFGNKEQLLTTLFETNWTIFARAIEDIAKGETTSTQQKLTLILDFVLNAYERSPHTVRVLVNEYARNLRLADALNDPEVDRVFRVLGDLFRSAHESGEISGGAHPRAMTILFLGSLETALASFIMQSARADKEAQARAIKNMRNTLLLLFDASFKSNHSKTK